MKKLIPVLLSLLMALAMTATALAATVYTEAISARTPQSPYRPASPVSL